VNSGNFNLKISLLTVPVEVDYSSLAVKSRPDTDIFVSSTRSDGQLPIMPKIAIISLIKWMEVNGFSKTDYDFFDIDMLLPSDEELIDYLQSYQPSVVGLSAVVSTCYAQVKKLSAVIRKILPDCWIVLGGSLTASANLVLNKTNVDICIVGDGEIAWVNLLNYFKSNGYNFDKELLSGIAGLAYLDDEDRLIFTGYGPSIPGGSNQLPDYDILKLGLKDRPLELNNYFRRGLGSTAFQTDPRSYESHRRPMLAQLWTSKGCVARCTFCQRSTKGYRTFSIEAFDEHLQMLADRYNVGFIHILDENFGSNNAYARSIAECMNRRGMLWMASGVRVTSVDRDDIKFFKENGCVSLKFGVESGSQKILDVMEKKFTVERVYDTLIHCYDLSVYSPLAVMVGMPGETNETASETGAFLGRLSYMSGVDPEYAGFSVFYALPLPGTPLFVYGQQLGVIGKSPDEEEAFLMSVSGTGANKPNYVNLSGAYIKDVIWWDWLIKLEARRTFDELVRRNGLPKSGFLQEIVVEDKKREIIGNSLSLWQTLKTFRIPKLIGWKARLFYMGDDIMEHVVVPNKLLARLPRILIYPALRNLLFAHYLLMGIALDLLDRKLNLWKKWPSVDQLKKTLDETSGVDIEMSLRRIVNRPLKAKSEPKQAHDILSIGL